MNVEQISYRQWLAGLAMQGLVPTWTNFEEIADRSVRMADALIAKLEEKS